MAEPSQQIEELREELAELRETIETNREELVAMGLEEDDDEADKENVEIPAAGRTNWEAGNSSTVEVAANQGAGETHTEEVPLQGGDIENPETMTVERANRGQSWEDIEDARAEMRARMVEDDRERKRERQKRLNERQKRSQERNPYTLSDDEAEDAPDVPAAGRSNWEARQEDDDR